MSSSAGSEGAKLDRRDKQNRTALDVALWRRRLAAGAPAPAAAVAPSPTSRPHALLRQLMAKKGLAVTAPPSGRHEIRQAMPMSGFLRAAQDRDRLALVISRALEVQARWRAAKRTAGSPAEACGAACSARSRLPAESRATTASAPAATASSSPAGRGRRTGAEGSALSLALEQRHAREPVHENPRHDAAELRRARSARKSRSKSSPICSSRTASPPERASSRAIFRRSTNCASSRQRACGTASSRRPRPSAASRGGSGPLHGVPRTRARRHRARASPQGSRVPRQLGRRYREPPVRQDSRQHAARATPISSHPGRSSTSSRSSCARTDFLPVRSSCRPTPRHSTPFRSSRKAVDAGGAPNFALVQVIGCLAGDCASGWTLTECRRARRHARRWPTAAALRNAESKGAGTPDVEPGERGLAESGISEGRQGRGTRAPLPRARLRRSEPHVASNARANLRELTNHKHEPRTTKHTKGTKRNPVYGFHLWCVLVVIRIAAISGSNSASNVSLTCPRHGYIVHLH